MLPYLWGVLKINSNFKLFSKQMYVPTRLINKETGEIKEQEVLLVHEHKKTNSEICL